jgi:hypothetical protein
MRVHSGINAQSRPVASCWWAVNFVNICTFDMFVLLVMERSFFKSEVPIWSGPVFPWQARSGRGCTSRPSLVRRLGDALYLPQMMSCIYGR